MHWEGAVFSSAERIVRTKPLFHLRFRRKADILKMILSHFCDVKNVNQSTYLL